MFKVIEKYFKRRARFSLYKDYEVEDYLSDEFFVQWAVNHDEETAHFWEKWLRNNPEKVPQVLEAKEIAYRMNYKNRYQLSNQQYTDIYETILNNSPSKEEMYFQKSEFRRWFNIAAILCLGIGLSTYFYKSSNHKNVEKVRQSETLTRITKAGEKLTITLSDGSKVKLNSVSKLKFPDSFGDGERIVNLEGEAYFEVAKDTSRPFIIKTQGFDTEVLGTSFNLISKEHKNELALVEGAVKIKKHHGESVFLKPDQKAVLNTKGDIEISEFDVLTTLGWKDAILVFDNDKLPKIIETLENWYGVEIELEKGAFMNGSYTGIFKDESLENVLRGISATCDFQYEINSKKVFLTSK